MKDKRVKCCPNEACGRDPKHKRPVFSAEDKYCTACGSELVFACSKCLGPLSDKGPGHRVCGGCEAKAADRKAKAKDVGGKVAGGVAAIGGLAIGFLKKR